jgi:hypothetical protein
MLVDSSLRSTPTPAACGSDRRDQHVDTAATGEDGRDERRRFERVDNTKTGFSVRCVSSSDTHVGVLHACWSITSLGRI